MNSLTKLIVASVAVISTQAMADTAANNNPFAAIEPAGYSQEANLKSASAVSSDVVELKVIEPASQSKESQLTDSNDFYNESPVAFHATEPFADSKEALL